MCCLEKLVVGNTTIKPLKRKILLLCENYTMIVKLIISIWVLVSEYFIELCGIWSWGLHGLQQKPLIFFLLKGKEGEKTPNAPHSGHCELASIWSLYSLQREVWSSFPCFVNLCLGFWQTHVRSHTITPSQSCMSGERLCMQFFHVVA